MRQATSTIDRCHSPGCLEDVHEVGEEVPVLQWMPARAVLLEEVSGTGLEAGDSSTWFQMPFSEGGFRHLFACLNVSESIRNRDYGIGNGKEERQILRTR